MKHRNVIGKIVLLCNYSHAISSILPLLIDYEPYIYMDFCNQIEALKAVGVTEVVLAISYQPEVK